MTTTYSWTILIFMILLSIVFAQSCKWLHRKQEVNKQILQNFKQMIPSEDSPGVCLNSSVSVPNITHLYNEISKVESAAIAVREVSNQTIQFYRSYGEKLDLHWPAWERFQELLYYQEQQLSDCIPEGAENQLFVQGISQQFIILQRILEEQEDKVCAWRAINAEIQKNLLLASQLSSRMRKPHLLRSLS